MGKTMKVRMIQAWIAPWRNMYNPGDEFETTAFWAKWLCDTKRAVLVREKPIETTVMDTSDCEQMVTRTVMVPPVVELGPPAKIKRPRGRPRKVQPQCP